MNTSIQKKRSPLIFFLLVFAISTPFWVFNAIFPRNISVDNLPMTDIITTFIPLIVASILIYRAEKFDGVKNLLKRTFDYKRIKQKIWFAPIIFLMPLIYLLTYWIMRLIGLPLPAEWNIPVLTPLLFVVFFIAAAGEELGYMGYVIDPMQERLSALTTCLIVGLIHAVWHYPSAIQMGYTPGLMVWGATLLTISFRFLSVWFYNNTGKSVFAVILFHAVTNTGRSIFPGKRLTLEQADGAVCYGLITITAVIVVFLWGSKTLSRYRYARQACSMPCESGEQAGI